MKGRRDYTGNERGIPGGVWFTNGGKKHEKLKEFFKTHTYVKGEGLVSKEILKFRNQRELFKRF